MMRCAGNRRRIMNIETVKISVFELVEGMHVVKLDRPWLETPFKLQGFRIQSSRELRALEKYCKHVYIDVERGVAPPRGKGERVVLSESGEIVERGGFIGGSRATPAAGKDRVRETELPAPAVDYELESAFEQELPLALDAVRGAKLAVKAFMGTVSAGTRRDLEPVREAAALLEASVLRNPDPAMAIRALGSDEPFSYRHCVHSAILAGALARELGLRRQAIHELTMGVLLADIGKSRLPKELLRTTRRLDARETAIMQRHVPFGVEMARKLDGLTPGTIEIIAAHHERFDGSGYPEGLRGGEIALHARIAGLVDSFDAITSERAYSEAIPVHEAVQELYAATVDVFQRELVEKLIQVLGTYPIGSLVELSDGAVAVVVALNRRRRLLPRVIRLLDPAGRVPAHYRTDDLAAAEPAAVTVRDVIEPGQRGVDAPNLSVLAA